MKFVNFKNIFNYKNLYWFYILLIGLFFIFFVPPFQKPDEIYHYYHTYSSANDGCSFVSENGYMSIPKDVYEFPEKLQAEKIDGSYQIKFPISLFKNKYFSFVKEESVFNRSCVKFGLISYFPNIIGLKLGGDNLLLGFYLSRLVGFLFFLGILIVSIKLSNKYYPLIIAFSVIPMLIHQVTSVSYDSLHISLGLISFSFYLYLKNNFSKTKLFSLFLFYVLLLVFTVIKGGYFLLLALPLLLPPYHFFEKNIKNLIIKFLILIFYFLLAFFLIKSSISYMDEIQRDLIDTVVQKKIVLDDPFYFFQVLNNTLYERFHFYWKTFLGNFGSLDYELHISVSLLLSFVIFFIISSIKLPIKNKTKSKVNDLFEVLFVFGIAIGTYIIIETSLYLIWTPLAGKIIDGVQGRYLFIPFLFLIYGLVRLIEFIGTKKTKIYFSVIVVLVVMISIVKSTYLRYYDYSSVYENINEITFDNYKNYKKDSSKYKVIPVIDNELCENIDGYKVGGFAIYFVNNLKENEVIKDVFKYEILSNNRVLYSGYLDQVKIQNEGKYLEEFKQILENKNGGVICVKLYRKYYQQNSTPSLFFIEEGGTNVRFLKISK